MPYISRITLPNNNSYDIKDATARSDIASIRAVIGSLTGASVVVFRGVSSTALSDDGIQNPTVSGTTVTTKRTGDVYFYGTEEFIWGSDNKWHALGSLGILNDFAYVDQGFVEVTPHGNISSINFSGKQSTYFGTFTPAGSVTLTDNGSTSTNSAKIQVTNVAVPSGTGNPSTLPGYFKPEGSAAAQVISVKTAGSTTTIKNPTKVTVAKTVAVAAPGSTAPSNNLTYYSYDTNNETLKLYQIGYTTGDSITTSDVTVKTGDAAYQAAASPLDITPRILSTNYIKANWNPTANQQISVTGTPSGQISTPTFTGMTQSWIVYPGLNEEGEEVDPGGLTGG